MFKNLKLKNRILLGYLAPILLLLAVMAMVYPNLRTAAHKSHLLNETASFTADAMSLSDSLVRMQRASYAYVLINGKMDAVGGYPKKIFESSEQKYQLLIGKLIKQDIAGAHQDDLRRLVEVGNNIMRVNRHYMTLIDEGKEEESIAEFRRGEGIKLASQMDPLMENIMNTDMEHRTQLRAAVTEAITTVQNTVAIGATCAMVLMVAFGLWTASRISRSVSDAINALSSTSTEIAATVNQHERTASQQAAMVNETTATVDELGASARQMAEQAASAAAVAQKASNQTEEGAQAVKEVIEAMNGLKDKIAVVAEQILRLGDQTNQIGGIASLVGDIAGQTRMLALNAAVEAARAGEQGKGFAVVASEVRKLADQSKKSAEQANSLIAEIQKATNSTIMKTEEGTKAVEGITRLAWNVGELFNGLSTAAGNVYENAQQVLLNTTQQTAAISQVIAAMGAINTGAKETAAGVSQTKIGIENLNETTKSLKEMV